ncbi:uncharacterized protein TM35_001011000, partial [Trypanosoma theileri]
VFYCVRVVYCVPLVGLCLIAVVMRILSLSYCGVVYCLPCESNVRPFPPFSCYHRSKQLTVTMVTTMFVQLRRVVYLLVFLQFCLDVCAA